MARIPVELSYIPGIFGNPFPGLQATLVGSWDGDGRYSDDPWSEMPMVQRDNDDGGIRFSATTMLDQGETGKTFNWGVRFDDGKGTTQWGITTEVPDPESQACHRSFVFTGNPHQEESYYLTHCRRLGANKYRTSSGGWGIRFAVWAPNARNVELVFGTMWDKNDRNKTLRTEPFLLKSDLAGGYIADNGDGIDPDFAPLPMDKGNDGIWTTKLEGEFQIHNHRPYMYRITREGNDTSYSYRTDLYSRCQVGFGGVDPAHAKWSGQVCELDGTVSCSAIIDPETVTGLFDEPVFPEQKFIPQAEFWADEPFEQRLPKRIDDLIIYQLHIGALGFKSDKPGTVENAINILDHIKAANFNAVELLPMSEFGGRGDGWGYNTSHYFAIEYSGGGRDKFKYFVKECHRRGLAVIFDVVYNHFTDKGGDRAEFAYDSTKPEHNIYYWYEGKSSDYSSPEKGYVDNQSSGWAPRYCNEIVRKMFISSAVSLLLEFHVDGLRVDQTTSIRSYNTVEKANKYGAKLLRELGRTLRMVKPNVFLIAEDHDENPAEVTKPVAGGGMGFDACWYAMFYHHLSGDTNNGNVAKLLYSAALTYGGGPLRMDWFSNALLTTQYSKVVYSESHDEAGNSPGPFLDDTWDKKDSYKQFTSHRSIVVAVNAVKDPPVEGKTRWFAEARCRFAWGMTVLSAGVPMVLFGEEVGACKRFKYNAVLSNKEDILGMAQRSGSKLLRFYTDINALRTTRTGLRSRSIDIVHVHNDDRVIAFLRGDDREHFLVVASLADRPYLDGYPISNKGIADGGWSEIFNSDSRHYGGDDIGNRGAILPCNRGAINVVIPAAGFVVFEMKR